MIFYTRPLSCIIFILMLALHFPAVLAPKLAARVCSFVNLAVHFALVPVLLCYGAELVEYAALLAVSLASYLAISYVRHRVLKKREAPSPDESEGKA